MIVTITRHGETVENENDTIQGQLPGKLSERGLLQGQALADELKSHQFAVLLSTDLSRGLDTAKIIARYHDVPLIIEPLLRERCFGIYEGTSREKFYSNERSLPDPYSHRPEKGESFVDLYKRANLFIDKIMKEYKGKSLLVVTHGDFIRMCLGAFQGVPVREACQIKQSNTCINILQLKKDSKWHVKKFNDISHLGTELVSNNKTDV